MRLRLTILGLLLLSAIQIATAQTMDVSGVVKDSQGSPVIGASVAINNGGKIVAITDADGKFVVKGVKASEVLVFKCLGMITQKVKAKRILQVIMEDDTKALDETIVVAFGKEKRSAFTGSAAIVGQDVLEKKQMTNALSGLNGEVAGLQMVDNSGDPASEPTIRIRGFSSINAKNDPLIILDGAPYDGGINNINPNDIATVTVLKDAASNALYGARGANGVIMITTKSAAKGKGKTTINLDMKLGVNSNAAVDYDYVDNPAEYYEMFYRAARNYYQNTGSSAYDAHVKSNELISTAASKGGLGYVVYKVNPGEYLIGDNGRLNPNIRLGGYALNNGTTYMLLPDDWTDEAFRSALRQEYNLSVSSSLNKAQIYASLGYLNNEGIVYNSSYERYTARLKANWQANNWLNLGGNTSFAHSTREYISDASNGLFYTLRNIAPIYPVYVRDANGNILTDSNGKVYDYGDGAWTGLERETMKKTNPLQQSSLDTNETIYNNFTLNGFADITPFEGLKITLNGTVTSNQSRGTYTENPFYGYSASTYPDGYVSKVQTQTYSVNFQQLINYTKSFGLHNMTLLLGHENYKYRYDYLYGAKQDMASYFGNQNLAGAITVIDTNDYDSDSPTTDYNNEGWFFRGQYDYDNKYFGSISFRRDGSSRFHPDHRWGNFYSIGGAWIINKENWFDVSWINQLKLKASIGQQGNDNIGEYAYTDLYDIVNNNGSVGIQWRSKGNKNITWETNTNFNVGVEFNLWKNRLIGSIEYFSRRTTDMLCFISAPYEAGYSGSYYNIGDMTNKGIELDLNGIIIKNKILTWSTNINATHYKNEVTKLANDIATTTVDGHKGYASSYSDQFTGVGLPLYTWYLPKYAGVNEEGKSTWYTSDGGTTTSYGDAGYFLCGDPIPDLYGGFGTKVSAYGFDLSISFNYSIGGKAYDYMYATLMTNPTSSYSGYNFHRDLYDAWSETNTSSNIPRFVYGDTDTGKQSSRFLINSSYLSLQNINLGYTLPTRWVSKLGLSSVRIYGSADNLCYWSKRKGFDPRGVFNGETNTSVYSPMRSISGGINIQF